jgi:hypothetical protein
MIYRCKACNFEESRGCLPSASCGLYLFGLMYLWIGGAMVALNVARRHLPPVRNETSVPWWWWILFVPVGFAFAIFGVWLLNSLFQLLEWLVFAFRRCPRCTARRWSWGFFRGWGL